MRSLVPPWDYEELLWDLVERIRLGTMRSYFGIWGEDKACPRGVTDGNLGLD